jgi:hypothetical protein
MQLPLVQILHHFTNVLRVLPGRNQQSVGGFDHHQITHADRRNEFARSMHVVAMGIQHEYACAINKVAL